MPVKKCSKCGTPFECGAENRICWCGNYRISTETLEKLKQQYNNCLCEQCLQAYSQQQNAANGEGLPINS